MSGTGKFISARSGKPAIEELGSVLASMGGWKLVRQRVAGTLGRSHPAPNWLPRIESRSEKHSAGARVHELLPLPWVARIPGEQLLPPALRSAAWRKRQTH